jgi:hypothetical protein
MRDGTFDWDEVDAFNHTVTSKWHFLSSWSRLISRQRG